MAWDGVERRSGRERRDRERRRVMRYSARTLIIIDGVTWIDAESTDRRQTIRRAADRERVAARLRELTRS